MAKKTDTTYLQFPCDFPLKIIGTHSPSFEQEIIGIIKKHFPNTPAHAIRNQQSQQGNYLAMTVTVYPTNQIELDALYHELTQHPDIKMVL